MVLRPQQPKTTNLVAHFFGFSLFFFAIVCFFWKVIKNMSQKLGSNRSLLFTMITKQKFLNVLHSKLVKKIKGLPGLPSDPLSQWLWFFKRKWFIILGDLPFWRKVVYFHRRPVHTLTLVYFHEWSVYTLKLVYFHGQPAHTYSLWSIFRGDLPIYTHAGLFS